MHILAAVLFVASAVVFRLVTGTAEGEFANSLVNYAPMVGIVFCAAMVLPWRIALAVAFGALLLSDLFLNAHYASMPGGQSFFELTLSPWMAMNYAVYAILFYVGVSLGKRPNIGRLFAGTVAGVIGFYLLSNTAAWAATPAYPKSLAGWWQSQTAGLPGFPPSFVFLRNALVGNTIFASLFILFVVGERQSETGETCTAATTET
ncbi:MAG: DUF6580 family putative transport protein [Verrucomicrobiota bacterium]